MGDEQTGLTLSDALIVIQFLVGAFMALLTWTGKRQIKRLDDLEQRMSNTVTIEQYNETLQSLRRDIAEGNRGTHERIDKLMIFLAEKK